MLLIKRVDIYRVRYESLPGFISDRETMIGAGVVLIRITAGTGSVNIEGWGEAASGDPARTGNTLTMIADDLEYRIAPFIVGKNISSISEVFKLISSAAKFRLGMQVALYAARTAILNVLAKTKEEPLLLLEKEYISMEKNKANYLYELAENGNAGILTGSGGKQAGSAGTGIEPDMDFLEKITSECSVIFRENDNVVLRRFPYYKNKPDVRRVSEEIINLPG